MQAVSASVQHTYGFELRRSTETWIFFSNKYVLQYYIICGWLKPRILTVKLIQKFLIVLGGRGVSTPNPALFKGKLYIHFGKNVFS